MATQRRSSRGFTLIDVLMVVVLMGIVGVAVLSASGRMAMQSAQSLKLRQMSGVAYALLDEVRHMPYTYCDPQDARFLTATGATLGPPGCQTMVDVLGPEPVAGESRYGPNRFDGVSDYNGFTMPDAGCASLCWPNGQPMITAANGLTGCSATVAVAAVALPTLPAGNALRIRVTVGCLGESNVVVEAIRVRHAPNLG